MKQRRIFALLTGIVCATTLLLAGRPALAQEAVLTSNFTGWALTIDVPNTGEIMGTTDLEVSHPDWVSNRPNHGGASDPTDPANIAAAWTTDTFTNMRGHDGVVVPGATLHQEWIAVSQADAAQLFADGSAMIVSSGSFVFGLIRQTASPEATAAFGLATIDNGSFVPAADTLQGICG